VRKLEANWERAAQSPSVAFWGERLQLVREFRGLTQKDLGELLGVSHALISDYEKGKRFPAASVLEVLHTETGFLPGFFLRRLEDPFLESQCSFRHRRSTSGRLKDQVRAHATLLGIVVSSLREMFRFPPFDVPSLPAASPMEIEAAAEACRQHWGLDLNAPIMQVGRALERAGVVIIPCTVDTSKIDAFSRHGMNSLIFLNRGAGTRPSRWNFDLSHECGHLVMHRDLPTGSVETESAADQFASAFLLPRTAFAREFRTKRFSWEHVFELKRHWQVSAAAIVRRARDLGFIDENAYRRAFQYMSFKKWRTEGEPYEPLFQEPELFVNAINALGHDVAKTVSELCGDLYFSPKTFVEITGIAVRSDEGPRGSLSSSSHGKLLPFPSRTASEPL
jgi:Zn-dependent peptidase ImmA (M78 family)/transcriptional regulator with XRE-family HTH domain